MEVPARGYGDPMIRLVVSLGDETISALNQQENILAPDAVRITSRLAMVVS
jgi:hypothetical protein